MANQMRRTSPGTGAGNAGKTGYTSMISEGDWGVDSHNLFYAKGVPGSGMAGCGSRREGGGQRRGDPCGGGERVVEPVAVGSPGGRVSAGDGVPADGSSEPTRVGERRPGSTPPGCAKS